MRFITDEPIIRFRTVGLVLTNQCNFKCDHCIADAGPKSAGSISLSVAKTLIREIARESAAVCFTGGECLLSKEQLLECIEFSRELGLTPTLVTNGFWATDDKAATKMLTELKTAGLRGICVSLDRFHLKYVTAGNALRIGRISNEISLQHSIRVCRTRRDKFAAALLEENKDKGFNFQPATVLRLGRARGLPESAFARRSTPPPGRCTTVLSPLVLPNGSVEACCGPGIEFRSCNPFKLGDWVEEDLSAILRRTRRDAFVMAISNLGPAGLVKAALRVDGSYAFNRKQESYSSICDYCIELLNDRRCVGRLESVFAGAQMQRLLVAGQVYLQSFMFLKQLGFLELPSDDLTS